MRLSNSGPWLRAALLALPVTVAQVAVTQLQSDLGAQPFASASAQKGEADQRETRRTPALRNQVYEKLSEAQTAAEEENFDAAARVLDGMLSAGGKNELNSYELANVYNLYAFIHYSREDYAKALEAYENVIRQPDIPLAMEINTKYTVAQLHFVQENWRRGVETLLEWFAVSDNPPANAYVLLAQGYYQLDDYPKALSNVEKAINMHKEKGKIPSEQWYNLARFLYFDKNDIPKAVATLEELLTHYPDKQYWVQLSHMYGEQKRDAKQLAAMETAYVQDLLDKGTEQVTMAYLYLNGEVPYKAGKVMDKGLKSDTIEGTSRNYEILGNAWRQAQEIDRAIPAMEQAAAKSEDGELYARLGNIYLDGDEYKKAIDAITKGLQRGGVKRPDTARLVLGMAYFNDEQYAKAREAFNAAGRDERSAQYAKQWINYMESELDRQKKLEEG
ncbi:tetratricopeptide repeat protein [Kineobactrum salinum]|uniref:Tetratricopeptide repeat protein n=2 Tax=Kineobactrum salinum TaxID=2708301 RepID=A0A6C0U6T6_9GAMM|nr:tetratricopeptide repeat protein [Kineobactrum salinum]QIB67603.1 tetratricopeptide repeat protein [Kineobactrum salinum]